MASREDQFDAIAAAATKEMVVLPTGSRRNKTQEQFHKPAFDGAHVADCGNWSREGQRLERRHAKMHGFEPCSVCFGGGQ